MFFHSHHHRIRLARLLLTGAVAAAAVAVPFAQTAGAALQEPTVPASIKVEDGHKLFLVGHAVGVQIYTCAATATGQAWGPSTPRADLYDDNGKVIITHFGGP